MISLISAIFILNSTPVIIKKNKPIIAEISKEQKVENLNKTLNQLCIKFSESIGKKVAIGKIFISDTTKPGEVGFVVFKYDENESETFGLLFLWREGSWKFLPEDFIQVPLSQ